MERGFAEAALLEVQRLTYRFGRTVVFSDVSIEAFAGECVLLSGTNGSGKTTLLRCLAGALRPPSGTILLRGLPLVSRKSVQLQVGFVAHESRLYNDLTVKENLLFTARMTHVRHPGQRVDRWLDRLGLGPWADVSPSALSRGTRRRAAIARALIHEPAVWLLDEPTCGLDERGTQRLQELVTEHCQNGGCCWIATHETMTFAEGISVRRTRLLRGKLEEERELSAAHSLTEAEAA